ncbi:MULTISPECIES: head-tail adaptor protein [unclassified Carboxylicivirga]|uniref:head-tail adaptor protein n=1 Tax=Carboxylicivirga TaxID=1628153 RepID=UPI003D3580A0
MRAGALRHTVDIYRIEKTEDDYNSEVEKEVLFIRGLKAARRGISFDEGESLNKKNSSQRIEWRIRYRRGVNEDCILVHEGVKYNIIGVDPLGRNVEMKLITSKV